MYWSDEVFRILGFKENSIEPTLNDYLKYVISDDVQKLRNAINRTMEKGQPLHIEYKIKLPDQTIKTIANQGQIQMSKKNKGLCLSGTIQDISVFANGISGDHHAEKIKSNLDQILQSAKASGDNHLIRLVQDTISLLKA